MFRFSDQADGRDALKSKDTGALKKTPRLIGFAGLLHSRKTLGLVGVTILSQMNLIQPFLEMSSSH